MKLKFILLIIYVMGLSSSSVGSYFVIERFNDKIFHEVNTKANKFAAKIVTNIISNEVDFINGIGEDYSNWNEILELDINNPNKTEEILNSHFPKSILIEIGVDNIMALDKNLNVIFDLNGNFQKKFLKRLLVKEGEYSGIFSYNNKLYSLSKHKICDNQSKNCSNNTFVIIDNLSEDITRKIKDFSGLDASIIFMDSGYENGIISPSNIINNKHFKISYSSNIDFSIDSSSHPYILAVLISSLSISFLFAYLFIYKDLLTLMKNIKSRRDISDFKSYCLDISIVANEYQNMMNKLFFDENNLSDQANYDFLTKALNRRGGEKILREINSSSTAKKINFSIISLDIDQFKKINDEHGHQVGDKILSDASSILIKRIKNSDYLIRWGGRRIHNRMSLHV
ncbi:diguanylate cyclase [Pseudomonadota bacterium]